MSYFGKIFPSLKKGQTPRIAVVILLLISIPTTFLVSTQIRDLRSQAAKFNPLAHYSFVEPVVSQVSSNFSFGAAGDFSNGTNFQTTVNVAGTTNPDFFIALGDLSYSTGGESSWCGKWNSTFNKIVLIVGNHDSGEDGGGNINNYVNFCSYRPTSFTGNYGHQFYFDYPATNPIARFIQIRPGIGGSGSISYSAGSAGYNFTQSAIDGARTNGIPWVIVSMHKNYISMLEKSDEIGTDLMKLLLDKKVDLILQGHEHGYERSKQLTTNSNCITLAKNSYDSDCVVDSDNSLVKGSGSVIHVLGTGGQGLRSLNNSDSERNYFVRADNTTYGFGKFDVTPSQISFNFTRSGGGSLSDSFTIIGTDSGGKIGDFNDNGLVDILDLSYLLSKWGTTDSKADINKDGTVGILDLSSLLNNWG